MAAGDGDGESATAFLETSLDTRLAVSFARNATVADLKRQVSAEHATSFPRFGPIAVTSFKVNRKGSLYHLTDSMAVQAAFRGIKGAWYLQVDAVPCAPPARSDAKCGTDDTDNATHLIGAGTSNTVPLEESHGASNLALADMGQSDDGNTVPQESPDLDVAAGKEDGLFRSQQGGKPKGNKRFWEEDKDNEGTVDNCDEGLTSVACSSQDGGIECKHIPNDGLSNDYQKPKRICGQRDGALCKVDVTSVCTDVAAQSSDNEIPKASASLGKLQNQDKRADTLDKEEGDNSTGPADGITPLSSSCKHENSSVENKTQSNSCTPALSLSLNKNDSVAITEKHASDHVGDFGFVCPEVQVSTCNSEKASSEKNDILVKKCSTVPAKRCPDSATLGFDCNIEMSDKESNKTEQPNQKSDPLQHNFGDNSHDLSENPSCGQTARWAARVLNCEIRKDGSDILPCVESKNGDNSSQKDVRAHGDDKEPLIDGCNGESSKNGSNMPPCVESPKGNNTADKEAKAHRGEEEPEIAGVCCGGNSSEGTEVSHSVQTMKVDNSSLSEMMAHKGEEAEHCTGGVCNGERNNSETDPLSSIESVKGNNSSGPNVALSEGEKLNTTTTCAEDETMERTQSTKSLLNDQQKSNPLSSIESIEGNNSSGPNVAWSEGEKLNTTMTCAEDETMERTRSTKSLLNDQQKSNTSEAKEDKGNLKIPSQNVGKCSDGTTESERTRIPEDDLTKEKIAPHNNQFGLPNAYIDLTSDYPYFNKGRNEGATSPVRREQEACLQIRRQRVAIRKVPMSRVTKTYGFSIERKSKV
ncbi:hypothetical protein ACP4OV_028686 [Aristida adscensionis]